VQLWCGRRDLNPGRQRGRTDYEAYSLKWAQNRVEFVEYLQSKSNNERYVKSLLSYLDKNFAVIREPMDVVRIFAKLSSGQQHNLSRGLRNFFNFSELKGSDPTYLNTLRKAIPKDITNCDLKVPLKSEILASVRKLGKIPIKYQALYNLLLDSGLRLIEGVRLMNKFETPTQVQSFHRCTLGYFRGSKVAYAAYFTSHTLALIQLNQEEVEDRSASRYFRKYGFIAPKYLRKFAFDTMISEQLSIPESVADFIEGRLSKKIGARHYCALLRQADGHYIHYAEYLAKLRAAANSR
jgi:intergrase/recombinase